MLFKKMLGKIQLRFSKITEGKGKLIYNPMMNIYSRSGIVKFHFFNSVPLGGRNCRQIVTGIGGSSFPKVE